MNQLVTIPTKTKIAITKINYNNESFTIGDSIIDLFSPTNIKKINTKNDLEDAVVGNLFGINLFKKVTNSIMKFGVSKKAYNLRYQMI